MAIRMIVLTLSCLLVQVRPKDHDYISIEEALTVGGSHSIVALNQCRRECLGMKNLFKDHKFKFHRYILSESGGISKYITGECLHSADYSPRFDKKQWTWKGWHGLNMTRFDPTDYIWTIYQRFRAECEDNRLRLSPAALQELKFKRVHSNFQYFDNGEFSNLEPFEDLDSLFSGLSKVA